MIDHRVGHDRKTAQTAQVFTAQPGKAKGPAAPSAKVDTFGTAPDAGLVARAKQTVTELLAVAGVQVNGPNPWDITFHDPSAYVRILRDPDLQLGLTYMDGLWTCPAIDQLLDRVTGAGIRKKLIEPSLLMRTPGLLLESAARATYRYVRDSIVNRQTIKRSTNVAKEHYDVGNVLYGHQLGPTLAYTSGVFAPGYSLEDAQNAKHDLLCRKMGLKPGDRVLDIGSGFGAFARYAAKHYGVEVIGVTISNEQLKSARALSEGVPGVSFVYSDYRDIAKRFPKDHFDHVVSIEMIEAVGPKNLSDYLDATQACLKTGGTFALQAICDNHDAVRSNTWFSEYIFRDGVAPSRNQVDSAAAPFFGAPEDVHRITDSYDKTLMCWHENFEKAWPQLEAQYGERFKRMWDFYLRSIAGGFRSTRMNVDQVVYRKGGPDTSRAPVRELPSREKLDALRATDAEYAAIQATLATVEAHSAYVAKVAAPKPAREPKALALDARICVIGAGPSGLSVAHELRAKGYTNVVILEGSDRIGGKSFTVDFNGRAHDLGATMGVPGMYNAIKELGEQHGVHTTKFPKQVQYDLATGGPRAKKTFCETAALYAGTLQYLATNISHRNKGLEVPNEELAEPFGILAKRHGFAAAGLVLDTYLTGYGYGYPQSTPAVYGFRMLGPKSIIGAGSGSLLMWENGTTPIWEGVAKNLDVRLGVQVRGIDRSGDASVVRTSKGAMTFDRVVVACDPTEALSFLDASREEREVFGQIKHMPYSTFACRVRGVAEGRAEVGYLRENMTEDRPGHPMAWIKRYADDDVFVFHLFAPPGMSDDDVMARVREDMGKLGATSVDLVESRRWKFFPHVDADAMRCEKFFERARNLQGERGTFFANEVLSMSTMANVNEYAKVIAERVATDG